MFWRSHFGIDLPHHTSLASPVSAAGILVLHEWNSMAILFRVDFWVRMGIVTFELLAISRTAKTELNLLVYRIQFLRQSDELS